MRPESSFHSPWDAELRPHERQLVSAAQRFGQETLAAFVAEARRDRLPVSRDIVRAWAAAGLAGLQTPPELGGQGASFFTRLRVAQVMARHGFAAAFSLNNAHSLVLTLATQAPADLRARWLPALLRGELVATVALTEPGGGSDLAATRTTATRIADGWVIDGEKAWITNATIADLAIVTAQTGEGTRGIGRFIVALDAPGAERTGAHPVAAGHAAGLGGLRFSGVRVPDSHLLEAPGQGFKRAMAGINAARVHVAAMAVAAVEQALQRAVAYCCARQAFGRVLLEQQGLRWKLADVATQLEAASLLTLHAARLVERGEPAALAAAHAKKFAAAMALPAIETCMQCMGAHALLDQTALAHQLAEVKMAGYADGTTEIQNERIGRELLDRYGAVD